MLKNSPSKLLLAGNSTMNANIQNTNRGGLIGGNPYSFGIHSVVSCICRYFESVWDIGCDSAEFPVSLNWATTGDLLSIQSKECKHMEFFGLFSFLNLALNIGGIVFIIYVILQFLKLGRERNDHLQQILEELRDKDSKERWLIIMKVEKIKKPGHLSRFFVLEKRLLVYGSTQTKAVPIGWKMATSKKDELPLLMDNVSIMEKSI